MGAIQQIALGQGVVSPALTTSVSDSFTLSDAYDTFINSPALTKSVSDSFALTDALSTRLVPTNLTQSVADSFALSDAVTTSLHVGTLTTNLIAFWKLDEASGTRSDSVGGNHLTDNNTVTQAVGKIGNAAQFTAANNEFLSRADNTDLSTGDIDFTVAAWIYFDTLPATDTYYYIVGKNYSNAGQVEYQMFYYNGSGGNNRFRFQAGGDIAFSDNQPTISTSQWYFIVFWHDSVNNTLNIQINNGTVDSVAHATGVNDSTASFCIGAVEDGSTPFDGRVDAVGFWKRVLTADERTALYAAGSGIEWPF